MKIRADKRFQAAASDKVASHSLLCHRSGDVLHAQIAAARGAEDAVNPADSSGVSSEAPVLNSVDARILARILSKLTRSQVREILVRIT